MSKSTKGLLLIEKKEIGPAGERQPREAAVAYLGICATCANAPDCTFPRAVDRPVVQCEEWKGEIAAREADEGPQDAAVTMPRRSRTTLAMGLCATCEEYPTCAFVKPTGGVWHCEEYK
jgi:hypothetical protein